MDWVVCTREMREQLMRGEGWLGMDWVVCTGEMREQLMRGEGWLGDGLGRLYGRDEGAADEG